MEKNSSHNKNTPSDGYLQPQRRLQNRLKRCLRLKKIIFLIITGILFGFLPFYHFVKGVETELEQEEIKEINLKLEGNLVILQENSLLAVCGYSNPVQESSRKMWVVATGYSSTVWETDDDPYITAAGTQVREGVIANNFFPFGTKIKIPELYGDKVFIVEDRMHWTKSNYHIDIWFPDYWQALNFGIKITYIEILES